MEKVFTTVFYALVASILFTLFVLIVPAADQAMPSIRPFAQRQFQHAIGWFDDPAEPTEAVFSALSKVPPVVGLIPLALAALLVLQWLRVLLYGASLHGTWLGIRGLTGTRRVDLANAAVWVGTKTFHRQYQSGSYNVYQSETVPALFARSSTRTVVLPLKRGFSRWVSPAERRALAQAMLRPANAPGAAEAYQVATYLQQFTSR